VSPAFSRTKLVLFSPFRKGRTWKLAVTAYLATMSEMFLPFTLIALFFIPLAKRSGGPAAVVVLVAVSLVLTVLYLVFLYLCSRLRFAFFDIVLNRGEFVAPAWRQYGAQSFRWTVFKVVLGTAVTAVFALPTAAYIQRMISIFAALQIKPGEQPAPQVEAAIFAGYAVFFVIYLGFAIFYFASSLLSDFIVPSLALENTTLRQAFDRLSRLIRSEPAQFAAYAALKLCLAAAGYMTASMAFYIVLLFGVFVVGGVGFLIGLLLHAIGVPIAILTALAIVLGIALYLFTFFYAMILGCGTVLTFLESYTLYFLAGRYPLLGSLLERSTPPPTIYTPPPGYPPFQSPRLPKLAKRLFTQPSSCSAPSP